jgi:hypothetical protein
MCDVSFDPVRVIKRGALRPIFGSSTVARLRRCYTIFGLIPMLPAQRRPLGCESLYCCSDAVRGTLVTNLSPMASFHSTKKGWSIKLWDQTPNPTGAAAAPLRWPWEPHEKTRP